MSATNENKRLKAAQNFASRVRKVKKNWPVPIRLLGAGNHGVVFETNNGRAMKFLNGNGEMEFGILKRIANSGIAPRVRNGNIFTNNSQGWERKNFNTNYQLYANMNTHFNSSVMGMFIMNKVGNMTLDAYRKLYKPTGEYLKHLRNYKSWIMKQLNRIYHIRHGDTHDLNFLVSVNRQGQVTRMWIIDFGFASNMRTENVTPSRKRTRNNSVTSGNKRARLNKPLRRARSI
jgi:hypothetical protein